MTVYVDDYQRRARVGRLTADWSHLMADTSEELHVFAAQLGLRRQWVQHAGKPLEHYDLTEPKRQLAIRLGAVQIQYGEGGYLTLAKRQGQPFDLTALREHRDRHLTDGHRHDDCDWCLNRRRHGGTGLPDVAREVGGDRG